LLGFLFMEHLRNLADSGRPAQPLSARFRCDPSASLRKFVEAKGATAQFQHIAIGRQFTPQAGGNYIKAMLAGAT
jgi:hypothetical protein